MRSLSWILAFLFCSAGIVSADGPKQQWPPDKRPARQERGARDRVPDRLRVGDLAPDFTLRMLKGKEQVTLSGFRDRQPVVLIFGSYT